MAKAKSEKVEILPARAAVYEETITLTLSKNEAEALLVLTGAVVGGGPMGEATFSVYDTLSDLLGTAYDSEFYKYVERQNIVLNKG